MTPRVAAASAAALAGGALSSAVGAGRAGLFVPIFSLFLGFRLRTDDCGQHDTKLRLPRRRRHPALDRPLIDYDNAALVLPTLLLGISLGVASNGAAPASLMAALLTPLLLLWSSFLTLQLLQVYASEASLRSWTLMLLQVPISLAATLVSMLRLQKRATLVPTGNAQWGWKELLSVTLCGLPAGCLGAMLGLGGAIIIRPTLLQARVDSQVCSATMGLLILLSSTLALVEYAILGQLPMDCAAYFLGLSFIAAMLGMFAGRWVLARSGSLSAATFMLAAIIGAGAVVIGSTSGLRQEETMESCTSANL
eukprot:SM000030S11363  [mRNA]  locus=s30:312828:315487:+ [translate_table: standard]